MFKFQRTLNKEVRFSGIGLHTGSLTNMTVYPKNKDFGIVFNRIDLEYSINIKALVENVVETNRGTTIGFKENKIYTIEHFLSALSGLGIDNAYIEIDNIEPPIFDGSSKEFINKILNVGIKKYNVKKKYITISKPIEYSNDTCSISILPCKEFKVTYCGEFEYGDIGKQEYTYSLGKDYIDEISLARTFCSIGELTYLKENGLIKGGDLNSGVIFLNKNINKKEIEHILSKMNLKVTSFNTSNSTLNNVALRYKNEPIRHKILDLIGDFSLLGCGIKGHIISNRGGHSSNVEIMKKINSIYG